MAFRKDQPVTVNAPGHAKHGRTGTVRWPRSDGDYEVEFPGSGFLDTLFGPAIFRADQLTPATH
jgi:hypothetical protein